MSIVKELGDKLVSLKKQECKDLLEYLKDTYNIENPNSESGNVIKATEIVEEAATVFDVVLQSVDPTKKVGVIKTVRTITNLGLKECKDIVDNLPKTIKEALPKADAEKLKEELEANGAKVELK
jgi:large subunit ribosomal protein L7/L12